MSRRPRPASLSKQWDVGADVQGDPQAALSAARILVDQGAACLIGPAITPESIAIANGVTIQKRVTIWPVGTSMRLRTIKDEGTIFRTVPPDSLQALALVERRDRQARHGQRQTGLGGLPQRALR